MTDPIADMLVRIRNANSCRFERVDIPFSKLKLEIARLLKEEGYIKSFKITSDRGKRVLRIYLKYRADNKGMIEGIRRISKPSLRVYVKKDKIPQILSGLGIAILSTPKGLMTDEQAKRAKLGGELICMVW
mgnify:FL=1